MRPIYSIPIGADFIDALADTILENGGQLDETAVVFPGKRPALYLRRRLAEKLGRPFYAPGFFSIESFIDYLVKPSHHDFVDLEYNDAIWILYQAVGSMDQFRSHPFKKKGFDGFYYWGRYLFSFINQIDAENVSDVRLHSFEKNAELGYDVPVSINDLLSNISLLRNRFHAILNDERLFTRGYKYLCACNVLDRFNLEEFRRIYFAGLFGLTGTEKKITKYFWERGIGDIIIEGDVEDWTILSRLVSYYGAEVVKIPSQVRHPEQIKFYSGFDTHAEVLKASGILAGVVPGKTAVVLPLSEALFPLLTFAVDGVDTRYNISLGYPLQRTPVFDLISAIIDSQTMRRDRYSYPVEAYLRVMLHPFVKNLTLHGNLRFLLLNLKGLLTGEVRGSVIAGRAFITPDEMERAVHLMAGNKEQNEGLEKGAANALRRIHDLLFRSFEDAETIWDYADRLEKILDFILRNTPVRSYVLSGEIFIHTFELLAKARETRFSREVFRKNERENRRTLCDFLLQFLKLATLPFETRPVEALEILGVLESRNIRFDTVIIFDVNEGVLPESKKIDPLIPVGIYDKLGMPSPEHNEEIYRYYFYRLVESAKDVHLIYIDAEDKPRSRYVEQLIWGIEKEDKSLDTVQVDSTSLRIKLAPRGPLPEIEKSDEVYSILLQKTYSSSHINDYIRCPVSFYFGSILGFEEKKEVSGDIDVLDRGKIIHRILFNTFLPYKDTEIGPFMYDQLLYTMTDALEKEFRHRVITGKFYLFKKLAAFKLESFLKRNVKEAPKPFIVKYLEQTLDADLTTSDHSIRLRGRIDRIDYSPDNDEYTVIDYKTGGSKEYPRRALSEINFSSMEDIHRHFLTFQLPLYVYLFQQTHVCDEDNISAKLIFLKTNKEEVLFRAAARDEREAIQERCMEGVRRVIADILDPSKPFKPFDNLSCSTCRFNLLCHV
ncbi:MAG: PD-(D/E)XK nuclease family protein [Syntrophobacterales bacterium]|jgi:CRISPR/Cas system-associated exonuclease Cas4 (RecB family)|nr:PD-(D/E)XK nuclease family protein [Syntrophobacterales bacterium]